MAHSQNVRFVLFVVARCVVLTVRPKISELAFRVFGRSLHPELFQTCLSRTIIREQYKLQIDITSSGHLITWQRHGLILSEVACSSHQPLPSGLQLYSDVAGPSTSKQIQHHDVLDYSCDFQLEPAEAGTFTMIQNELLKSIPCEGMLFQFQSSGRMDVGAISYVNIQSRQNSVRIRAFHTFPDAYIVLKSESVFQISDAAQQDSI